MIGPMRSSRSLPPSTAARRWFRRRRVARAPAARVSAARLLAAPGPAVRDVAGRMCAARGFPAPKWGAPGPAMAVIWSVVARVAAVVRGAAAVYVLVQVAIWHDYYAAHPWYLAGQVAVTVWFAPRVLALLLGLVPEAAYWASAAVTPPGPAQGNALVVSSVLLLVVLIIHWAGRTMLYHRAAQADRGFAAADAEAHDQYVVLSRNVERREHERLLHDTVLNTLTAISRGSRPSRPRPVPRSRLRPPPRPWSPTSRRWPARCGPAACG